MAAFDPKAEAPELQSARVHGFMAQIGWGSNQESVHIPTRSDAQLRRIATSRPAERIPPRMPNFTADQIHTLIAALPSHVAKRKRTVLRLMLDEWGRIDLEEHLKR